MRRLLLLAVLATLLVPSAARAADPVSTLLGTASSAKARTGLGLPSYKKLLGKGWKQKAAKADAAFVRELISPRVNRQTEFGDDPLKAGDVLKGRGGKQTRELRMMTAITTGECPAYKTTDLPYMPFYFGVDGVMRGDYVVTTTERVRNFDIITTVVFEVRVAAGGGSGPDGISGPTVDTGTISVTRSQVARDRRSGKSRRTGPTQRYTSGLSPLFILEGGFDEFIKANGDGDAGPAPRRELRAPVWTETAQGFVGVLYWALAKDWDAVEKRMLTPNACVQLTFDGPERLAPGQKVDITGHLALTRSAAPEESLLKDARIRSGWLAPDVGQKLRWLVTGDNDIGFGKPWFELTAPPQAWPEDEPMGADVQIATPGGVAEAGIRFKPVSDTLHFQVLAATMDTRTTASGEDTYCGTQAGSKSYAGELATTDAAFDPNDKVTLAGGIEGEVDARLATRTTGHRLEGCAFQKPQCVATMPDRTGTGQMSFSVQPSADPSKVDLRWTLHQPSVGFSDAGDPECNVHIWAPFDQEVARRTVPLATLQSTDPITMRFEGQGDLDKNHDGMLPAQIHHAWSYVFKLQRVGPDGQPL